MSELRAAHAHLAQILDELGGIECGPEVLAVWDERLTRGYEALPSQALVRLREWATRRLDEAYAPRAPLSADDARRRRQ